MSLVINTNNIATVASYNLHKNQTALQKSLARLSSGSKLVNSSDDAGGLAVSTKLRAAINRNVRAQQNVDNAISFLQTQDGALKVATGILDRISELKTMSLDPTKNAEDIATYNTEFKQLQAQLVNISKEKFNGIDLFNKMSNLTAHTTEDGTTGLVNLSRDGLFEELDSSAVAQTVKAAFAATDGGTTSELVITTPTHGLSATVTLSDGATSGQVNGSDISAQIKGINDALELAGITTVKASESSDGELVLSGTEGFTVAETGGVYAGLVSTNDNVAKTYEYNALADYRVGDVVTGTRSDGTQETFLITNSDAVSGGAGAIGDAGVTGNGRSFDQFAALAETTRLNNNANPGVQVFVETDGAGAAVTYDAGEVVYDDSNGRYYLTRGASADYSDASTSAANAQSKTEFLELGSELPGLSDFEAYSTTTDYSRDDIVSYDGNLYVATASIDLGQGSPLDNNTLNGDGTGHWVKLSVSVNGSQNLMDMDNDLSDFSVAQLKAFIQLGATSRAQNGAEMARLEVSNEMLATNHTNLEAANSRLADVDVAIESTQFAKNNILVQSAAAMLAQANTSQSVALSLLQ
jgi:flagellin